MPATFSWEREWLREASLHELSARALCAAVGVGFSVFVLVEVEKAVLRHWQRRKSQGPNSFT